MASQVKDKAGQVSQTISGKLGQQRENAAEVLNRVASRIQDTAESVTDSIADGVESSASYLRDHDVRTMGKDVMNIARRYPMQSLGAALAIGFFIGRSRK